uniref:Uncharacterized protein n=1 Tax=Parascaris univalens TaxID=6257 RepID=A0A914ZY97_PARUN
MCDGRMDTGTACNGVADETRKTVVVVKTPAGAQPARSTFLLSEECPKRSQMAIGTDVCGEYQDCFEGSSMSNRSVSLHVDQGATTYNSEEGEKECSAEDGVSRKQGSNDDAELLAERKQPSTKSRKSTTSINASADDVNKLHESRLSKESDVVFERPISTPIGAAMSGFLLTGAG